MQRLRLDFVVAIIHARWSRCSQSFLALDFIALPVFMNMGYDIVVISHCFMNTIQELLLQEFVFLLKDEANG